MVLTGRQMANLSIVLQEMENDETFFDQIPRREGIFTGDLYIWQKRYSAYLKRDGEIEWVKRDE